MSSDLLDQVYLNQLVDEVDFTYGGDLFNLTMSLDGHDVSDENSDDDSNGGKDDDESNGFGAIEKEFSSCSSCRINYKTNVLRACTAHEGVWYIYLYT